MFSFSRILDSTPWQSWCLLLNRSPYLQLHRFIWGLCPTWRGGCDNSWGHSRRQWCQWWQITGCRRGRNGTRFPRCLCKLSPQDPWRSTALVSQLFPLVRCRSTIQQSFTDPPDLGPEHLGFCSNISNYHVPLGSTIFKGGMNIARFTVTQVLNKWIPRCLAQTLA